MKCKAILLISTLLFTANCAYSQSTGTSALSNAEVAPKFKGDLQKYLADNIKYPEAERKNNIEGTVYVDFIIETDGSVSHVQIYKGVDSGLNAEAMRVVANMPNWEPGKQKGNTVRVSYNLPIWFMLTKNPDSKMPARDTVASFVQVMPQFKGNLFQYLADSIRYPEAERMKDIQGKVYITFVVEKDGSVTNVKVLRGVKGGPGLDAEAVRVISGMPKWIPGTQDGVPVRVQYNLPLNFALK